MNKRKAFLTTAYPIACYRSPLASPYLTSNYSFCGLNQTSESPPATITNPDFFGDGSEIAYFGFDKSYQDYYNRYSIYLSYSSQVYYIDNGPWQFAANFIENLCISTNCYLSNEAFSVSLFSSVESFGDDWPYTTRCVFSTRADQGAPRGISLWFYNDNGTYKLTIVVRDDNITVVDQTIYDPAYISLNTIYHLVLTFGNNKIKLYKDGQLAIEINTTGTFQHNNLVIGAETDNNSTPQNAYPHRGIIDQMRIFNKTLTEEEILQLSTEYYPLSANLKDPFKDSSIISFIPFEDTTIDLVTGSQLPWTGNEQYSEGILSRCALFDGNNSYIDIKNITSQINWLEDLYSISVWFYYNDINASGYPPIFYINGLFVALNSNDTTMMVEYQGTPRIFIAHSAHTTVYVKPTVGWNHIVINKTQTDMSINSFELFYNGEKINITPTESDNPVTPQDWACLGKMPYEEGWNPLTGKIDQLRIFNRPLTYDEVKQLFYEKEG